jgi:hypothetical protein
MAYFNSANMITDPDSLYYHAGASGTAPVSANLIIDYTSPGAGTLQLRVASPLTLDGGVTLKCVYSKLKEVWKSDATLIKFPFPMLPITDEQFELINGWDFKDVTTKQLIRTGGWALKSADGATTYEEYAGIISLGSLADTAHPIYYTQTALTSIAATGLTSVFALTGPVNEAIKIFSEGTKSTACNYREYLKLFVREYGSSYADSTLNDIGVSILTYQAYRFPVSTTSDLKLTVSSPPTGTDYQNMTINWYATGQSKTATDPANYNIVINADSKTAKQVYEFVQYKLRSGQRADLDADSSHTMFGEVTPSLLKFVGDNLYVIYQNTGATGGIFIDNIAPADKNSVFFYDNTNTENKYAYLAALRINFGDNIVSDTKTKFTVFFTDDNAGDNTGRDYGTENALIVKDASGVEISYVIENNASSASWISQKYADFTYDYDGNFQRGNASKAIDAPITCVALGLTTSQYVKATSTIAKSKANSISIISSLERNFANN